MAGAQVSGMHGVQATCSLQSCGTRCVYSLMRLPELTSSRVRCGTGGADEEPDRLSRPPQGRPAVPDARQAAL